MRQDNNSLAILLLEFNIMFVPPHRRQIIYGKYKASTWSNLYDYYAKEKVLKSHGSRLAQILSHNVGEYYSPKLSISSFMGYLAKVA